jgi:glycosyltransferase involved in cell wall biosynthesis
MRVTHVITRLIVGGAQENTIASVLGLRQKPGLEVRLISGPSAGPEGSLESVFAEIPQALIIVPELVRPVHPPKDLLALLHLKKIFRETKPDIVHTHSGKAGILGRLAAARAGVPIIIHHIHGPSFGPFQGALANFIFTAAERYTAKVTTHFVCSANAMAKLYLSAGIERPGMYTRLFSGFQVESFRTATNDPAFRAKLGLNANDFVIGKIGRIAPLKGHSDLMKAVRAILPQCNNAKILFVGDGSLRSEIESEARALGLRDKVIFSGLVPPDEVPRYVGVMDCVAHLSYREALSRALPQALAAGKPVISYDFDGADEICLDGKTGFLIRTGDVAAVSQRLLQLASNAALREQFGKHGQQIVVEQFSVERMVNTLHELYLNLAHARGISAT